MSATHPPASRSSTDAPAFAQTLFRHDYADLALGPLPMQNTPLGEYHALPLPGDPGPWRVPVNHWSWGREGKCFEIIEMDGARALQAIGGSRFYDNRIAVAGDEFWSDYRVAATLTPLSMEGASPAGGVCGLIARYQDSRKYLALVLDRDGRAKLLARRENRFFVLADAPFGEPAAILNRPVELALTVEGFDVRGRVGEVELAARAPDFERGPVGVLSDVPARFGPIEVTAAKAGAAAAKASRESYRVHVTSARARYPKMKLARTIPLHGLVNGRNLRLADVNGDGNPEIIVAQRSKKVTDALNLTEINCLTVLDLQGEVLWQAGVPDEDAPFTCGDAPFQVHDIDGDGNPEVICAFGYDLQIRDGKRGKILWSAATPETAVVGQDFKDVTGSWGSGFGDETLNMNVSQIAVVNTKGRPFARELIVKDHYHHLVVLDPDVSGYETLIKRRGVQGHFPWVGDLDGDGHDEIMAGYTLLDHDGVKKWSLHLQDHQDAIAIVDPLAPGGKNKRIFMCGGEDGLLMLGLNAEFHTRLEGHVQRMGIAKFRADLPGLQIATVTFWGNPGIFSLHDATGKQLWSRELPVAGGLAAPVNWTGRDEELMLYSMVSGGGLLDGHGDLVVEAPADGPHACFDVTSWFSEDGRDALIAWDRDTLAVYLPDDGPLFGDKKKNIYKPVRSSASNKSNYQAYVSLPPGW